MLFCRSLLVLSALVAVESQTSPPTSMPTDMPETIGPVCFICGSDMVVGNPDGILFESTCAEWELAGLRGGISFQQCVVIRSSAPANCGCVAAADFQPTVQPAVQPTFQPTSLPSELPPDPSPGVTDAPSSAPIPDMPGLNPTVQPAVQPTFQPTSLPSELPPDPSPGVTDAPSSAPIPDMPGPIQPTSLPSEMPTDPSPGVTDAPSSAPIPDMPGPINPVCYICGDDKVVGNPDGMLINFSCAQAELAGLRGGIASQQCDAIQSSAGAPANCGCVATADFDCRLDTCTTYPSMADIKLAAQYRMATTCMCAGSISPDGGGCAGSLEDTVTIPAEKNMAIECVLDPAGCRLECPNAAFVIEGRLALEGSMVLSGGVTESRIVVAPGGTLTMNGVSFVKTSAAFTTERDLSGNRYLQVASGSGAGVYNAGDMTATNCNFYNCTAARGGGAIWTNGAAVIEGCEFIGNEALGGGAIYVDRGTATISENVFEDNSATANEDVADVFVGATATVEGCGNEGPEGDLALGCSSSTIARMASVLTLIVGSLSLIMAL